MPRCRVILDFRDEEALKRGVGALRDCGLLPEGASLYEEFARTVTGYSTEDPLRRPQFAYQRLFQPRANDPKRELWRFKEEG